VSAHREAIRAARSIVVKIGTTGLTDPSGMFDTGRLAALTDAIERHAIVVEAIDKARGAQVRFKTQVQEWKNILLRGDDPALLDKYLKSFQTHAVQTQEKFSQVTVEARALGMNDLVGQTQKLVDTHKSITLRYETTLAEAQAGTAAISATVARQVDVSLRGVDRDLENSIGLFADEIVNFAIQERSGLEARMQDRYLTLRWFIISVIAFSLVITAYVLTGALRTTRS
jgi:hypothetical protein